MKNLTKMIVSGVALFSAEAYACTVAPINEVRQKNELAAHALTKAGVSLEDVTSITNLKFSEYSADYIWTPMCPRGIKAEAVIDLEFEKDGEVCFGQISVEKKIDDDSDFQYFEVKELSPVACTAS